MIKVGMDIRGPNQVSVLSNRISVFQVYQNQPHSGYMKVRFGFYRIWIGVSKYSKNRYNQIYFRVLVLIGSSV